MTQEQITEGNRLIAEFMGWKKRVTKVRNGKELVLWGEPKNEEGISCGFEESLLAFHSDWNWIMEVMKKIESIDPEDNGYEVIIYRDSTVLCIFDGTGVFHSDRTSNRLNNTYTMALRFIEWYNQEQEKVEFTGANVSHDGTLVKSSDYQSTKFFRGEREEILRIFEQEPADLKTIPDIDNPEKYRWHQILRPGTDQKYGRLMYCPRTKTLRTMTFSEFYQTSIVD